MKKMPGNQGLSHELFDLDKNEGGDDSDYDPVNESDEEDEET